MERNPHDTKPKQDPTYQEAMEKDTEVNEIQMTLRTRKPTMAKRFHWKVVGQRVLFNLVSREPKGLMVKFKEVRADKPL